MNFRTDTQRQSYFMEIRLAVAKGQGAGERWIGRLGLADVNY